MPYSQGFKINVNKNSAEEGLYVLLKIEHPFLTNPVFLINDNQDFVLNGDTYLAMGFTVKRQNDIQGELPKVQLTIQNVGRSLVKWVDSSGGGRNAKITVLLARRSAQIVEEEIEFGVSNVSIDDNAVVFTLIIQNNLIKRAIRWVYDTVHAPGLF